MAPIHPLPLLYDVKPIIQGHIYVLKKWTKKWEMGLFWYFYLPLKMVNYLSTLNGQRGYIVQIYG